MQLFLQYYLPVFVLLHLLVTFVLPSLRVYRQTGINPVTFGNTDTAHDYIGFIMKLLTLLLVVAVVVFALNKSVYTFLVPVTYLQTVWIQYAGLVLIHLSLLWIIIAQQQMNQSWRIGIDEQNKTVLVTHGLFSVSRNPVFLGMLISTLGIFLLLPNAVTLLVTVTSYIVIQIQIRLEEAFLLKQHTTAYEQYKRRVRRLL